VLREIWSPLQQVDTNSTIHYNTIHALSATLSCSSGSTAVLSHAEYDRLHQLEFSHDNHSVTHISSSSMDAYIASSSRLWILNSGASSHMTGIQIKFDSLHLSNKFSSVNIADGTQFPIS